MRIDQPYGSRFDQEVAPLEPLKKYFIACEGKKTEYQYFKGLIRARLELGINPMVEIIPIHHSLQSRTYTEILLKNDYLGGSYNKSRIQFERNFKPYVPLAIRNSKSHATTLVELKENIGTSIGLLIEEMIV